MDQDNTKKDSGKRPKKILEHLIPGEKIIQTFFIPYKTTSILGFTIWALNLLLPIFFLVLSHKSEEISENTQTFIDIILGLWIIITISLLLLFGYGERYLILTNKRVIYNRESNFLFMRKLKKIREYTAKIADVNLVERKQYRYPDIQTLILGIIMILAGLITWIYEIIASNVNNLTENEEYLLKLIAFILIIIGGILIILNIFFFSRKCYKVIVVIGQTFPLPIMMGRIISHNVKSGYWVINGWRKDAKKMYEQFHNLIFELQDSQ